MPFHSLLHLLTRICPNDSLLHVSSLLKNHQWIPLVHHLECELCSRNSRCPTTKLQPHSLTPSAIALARLGSFRFLGPSFLLFSYGSLPVPCLLPEIHLLLHPTYIIPDLPPPPSVGLLPTISVLDNLLPKQKTKPFSPVELPGLLIHISDHPKPLWGFWDTGPLKTFRRV